MGNLGSCDLILDVAIMADISRSMNATDRARLSTFVGDIVDDMGLSPDGNHFALITFGPNRTLHNHFDDAKYHNADNFKDLVNQKVAYTPVLWGTRTDMALDLVVTKVFTPEGGERTGTKDVLLVFTDGEFKISPWDTERPLVPFEQSTAALEVTGSFYCLNKLLKRH